MKINSTSYQTDDLVLDLALDGDANARIGSNGSSTNVTWVDSAKGYTSEVANFNGSSSYIQTSTIITSLTTFTYSAWFNTNSTTSTQSIIGASVRNGPPNLILFGGNITFAQQNQANMVTSSGAYSANVWTHCAVTYDGTTFRMYINGELDNTATTSPSFVSPGNTQIGVYDTTTSYFDGEIGLVKTTNTTYTEAQIQELYQEGLRQFGPTAQLPTYTSGLNATAFYPLNGDALDYAGSNNGTWSGSEAYSPVWGGESAEFDGSSYISTAYTSTTTFSISCWIKTTQTTRGTIYAFQGSGSATPHCTLDINAVTAGKVRFTYHDGTSFASIESTTTVNDGGIYFVTAQRISSNSYELFVNTISEGTDTTSVTTISQTLELGRWINGNRFYYTGETSLLTIETTIPTTLTKLYNEQSKWVIGNKYEGIKPAITVPPTDTTDLVAEYNINGNGNDSFGSNDGTATNVTWVDQGIVQGGDFNGTTSVINCGSGTDIDDIFTGGGTISVWINPDGMGESNYGRIFDKTQTTMYTGTFSGNYFAFVKTFSTSNGAWIYPISSFNQWYHIVVTYDDSSTANDATFYVNGELVSVTEQVTPSGTATSDASSTMYIGNRAANDRTLDGTLALMKFYDAEISADEAKNLYNQGKRILGLEGFNPTFTDLEAYYDFAGNARDLWKGYNGTVSGATLTTDQNGESNSAYTFNGTSDYISYSSTVLPNGPITLSCWINTDTVTGLDFILSNLSNSTTLYGYNLYLDAGAIKFQHGKGGGGANFTVGGSTLSTATWYHIVVTWNATTTTNAVKIYIDGSIDAQGTATSSSTGSATNNFRIGELATYTSTYPFDGKIAYPIIFSKALSAEEVKDLYVQQSYRKYYPQTTLGINGKGLVLDISEPAVSSVYYDGSGYGNDSSSITAVTDSKKGLNNVMTFNGSTSQIDFSSTIIPIGAKTLLAWIKTSSATNQYIIGNGRLAATTLDGTTFWINATGVIIFEVMDSSGTRTVFTTSSAGYADGNWHLVAVTWDGTTGTDKSIMYVDGVQDGTSSPTKTTEPTADYNLRIGRNPFNGNFPFNGDIIGLPIYNRALTEEEIQKLYYSEFIQN